MSNTIINAVESTTQQRRNYWTKSATNLGIHHSDITLMAEVVQQAIKIILTFDTSYDSSKTRKTTKTQGGFVWRGIREDTASGMDYRWMFDDNYNAGTFGENGLGFKTCCLFLAVDPDKLRAVVKCLVANSNDKSNVIKEANKYMLDNFSSYLYVYSILYNNKYII